MELIQVKLKKRGPDVWIKYPPGFRAKNPSYKTEKSFMIGQIPCLISVPEYYLAVSALKKIEGQEIETTGMVQVDPSRTQQAIDQMKTPSGQLKLKPSEAPEVLAVVAREKEVVQGVI